MTQSYSLFEVNEYIKRVLALNFAEALWICCEIAQIGESGGHIFLDLVQKSEETDEIVARAEAVIWQRSLKQIKKKHRFHLDKILLEGNEILIKAEVDFHERYGLKFNIVEVDSDYTIGKILVQRNETLQQLRKEGIFHQNSKMSLPGVIQSIGVISSLNAAGLQDYLQQIQGNPYGYDMNSLLLPAYMQGDKAAKAISQQLQQIRPNHFDCIVLIRGGGAKLDLSAFDEYELGKAIALCPVPVITGIGHDVDETVADQVAHTSLKTPTAVADFIIHHNAVFEAGILQTGNRIKEYAHFILQKAELALNSGIQNIHFSSRKKWQASHYDMEFSLEKLKSKSNSFLSVQSNRLELKSKELDQWDMEQLLEKGYAKIMKNGKNINSIEQLKPSDDLIIVLKDGSVDVNVKNLNKN